MKPPKPAGFHELTNNQSYGNAINNNFFGALPPQPRAMASHRGAGSLGPPGR